MNNDLLDNGVVFNPNPDTIAEFRIMESDYSAEYGRNGGGIISVVTKSGTNEWHGSAFEFLRNDAFNANSFFNKVQDLAPGRPEEKSVRRHTSADRFARTSSFSSSDTRASGCRSQQISGDNPVFTPAEIQGDFSHAISPGQQLGSETDPSGNPILCQLPGGCPDPGVVQFLNDNAVFRVEHGPGNYGPDQGQFDCPKIYLRGIFPDQSKRRCKLSGRSHR